MSRYRIISFYGFIMDNRLVDTETMRKVSVSTNSSVDAILPLISTNITDIANQKLYIVMIFLIIFWTKRREFSIVSIGFPLKLSRFRHRVGDYQLKYMPIEDNIRQFKIIIREGKENRIQRKTTHKMRTLKWVESFASTLI